MMLTYVDDGLYLVVGAVSQVAEGPAGVREHLLVRVVEELGQRGKAPLHGVEWRRWVLVATQVGQRPCHVAQKRRLNTALHKMNS